MRTLSEHKGRFKQFLRKRGTFRLHTFLIFTSTILTGLITSKILLSLHFYNMAIRYAIAIMFSYLMFFGFMKLWLLYMTSRKRRRSWQEGTGDIVDVVLNSSGTSGGSKCPSPGPVRPGGGHFGGGGASGSFETSAEVVHQAAAETVASAAPEAVGAVGEGVVGAVGEGITGEAAASIFEGGIALIVIGLVVAIIGGIGAYILYEAPAILFEAAFEAVLAASLVRRMKKMEDPDWVGSVVRMTIVPFVITLFIAVFFALIVQTSYPNVIKLSDLF